LKANGFESVEAAVLCRGNAFVDALRGGSDELGQGATEKFACAAISRDRRGDIAEAFEFALDGALRVLQKPPATLRRDVLCGDIDALPQTVRRLIWRFLRNVDTGIPTASLGGKTAWLPQLKGRLPALLDSLEQECNLARLESWKSNVTAARLGDEPLWQKDLIGEAEAGIPVQTVHQAKGETIGAVLYVAKTTDVKNLLAGPCTEEGRIAYVAVTRASDLLMLGIPATTPQATLDALQQKGFVLWQ
jgi:hypothetical protein